MNKKVLLATVSAMVLSINYSAAALTAEDLGNSKNISWEKVDTAGDDTVEIKTPDGTEYFKYTYTMPEGYTEVKSQLVSPTSSINGKSFRGISTTTSGAAIVSNGGGGPNFNITADFIGNSTDAASAGAIYNAGPISNITGDFIDNYAEAKTSSTAHGGAIYNSGFSPTIGNLRGDFIKNHILGSTSAQGGAIYNTGTITSVTGNFIGNYAEANSSSSGGAIYNTGTINLMNADFYGNYVSGNADSDGGAIYSTNNVKITADNGTSEFTGNYVLADGNNTENAIYMASATKTLTLNAENNGKILFNDEIDGTEGYAIALTGDKTGTIDFNNDIRNANISLENATVNMSDVAYLNNNNALTIASGKFNVTNLGVNDVLTANAIIVNGGVLNIASADVDFAAEKMGQLENITVADEGKINVDNFVILNAGTEEKEVINVAFGDENTQSAIETTVTESLAPIYKYNVVYNAETGEFVFTRGDKINPDDGGDGDGDGNVPVTPIRPITPAYKAYNPGVFAGSVLSMAGLNLQSGVINQITDASSNGLSSDYDYTRARVWATPYYSDDTIEYKDFYDVDSKNYGLVAGVDSRAFGYANGWTAVYTAFGAYNKGEDKYQGVKVDNNSWLIGLKASIYNGGFYGDAIINYAWHDGKSKSAFGTDSIDATGYGIALKAGYKYDVECNRWKTDTSLLMSWQRVSSDDYTAKSGVKVENDDFSRLTLTPQFKVGYRALKYWTPYALARYNFIVSEDGSSKVNGIDLPEIENKGYVEYGLGVETANTGDHSGYAHVLRHDGGRSGWSATAGYRYNF